MVALNSYAQYDPDSPQSPRIEDALSLFDAIVNNKFLEKVPLILFLNKLDVFKRTLEIIPLQSVFSDYHGIALARDTFSA